MNFILSFLLVILAVVCRVAPHPWNFAPVGAIALFGGATFASRRAAYAVPLFAMFVADAFIGFHSMMPLIYATYALIVTLGVAIREQRRSPFVVAGAALLSATLFFVVTNLAVWMFGSLYPRTWQGLIECYVAAIPFFERTLTSDFLFAALLFGCFALGERRENAAVVE